MADDIKQSFTIDVSAAMLALGQLDRAYQQHGKNLDALAESLRKFNRATNTKKIDSLATSINSINATGATTSLNALGNAARNHAPNIGAGAEQLKSMAVSLETLSRVVATQAVVRALSGIRRGLEDSVESSKEFQKQIALIQTIDNSGTGFDDLAAKARVISKSLGVDQVEVAKGAYQALGNQVGTTAESFQVLDVAARFAKATGSTTADSVDLISGALNSYKLEAGDAEAVASKFFVAIDKGRITASELANTIGRVAPVGAELGVSLDEINGFLAASTVTGTKASEAITQLRGLMSSFLKPSKEMQKALKSLGFENGQAAIKALGLKGAVDAVSKASGGGAEDLAAIFPNVRALTGVVAALRSQTKIYNETVGDSERATGLLGQKLAIVAATDANKMERAITGIGTSFSESFGDNVTKAIGSLTDFAGGAEKLSGIGTATARAAESIGVAIAILGGRAVLASDRTGALLKNLRGIVNTPVGGAGTVLALAPLAVGAGKAIGGKFNELLAERSQQSITAAGEDFQSFAAAEAKKLVAAKDNNKKLSQLALQTAAELSAAYNASGQQLKNSFKNPTEGVNKFIAENTKLLDSLAQQKQQLALASKEATSYQQAASGIAAANGTVIERFKPQVDEIRGLIQTLSTGQIDSGQLATLLDKMRVLREQRDANRPILGPDLLGVTVDQLTNATELIRSAKQSQANAAALPSATQLDERIKKAQENLRDAAIGSAAMATSIGNGATAAETLRVAAEATAAAYERAERSSGNIGGGGQAVGRRFGGRMSYFAAGGRGLDTIPAMLSPGEFVVNAKSTRRFFSQIQAINAGSQPVFRHEGGSTYIGDTVNNVTVNAADSPQATADAVIARINRAQRRGSARIR